MLLADVILWNFLNPLLFSFSTPTKWCASSPTLKSTHIVSSTKLLHEWYVDIINTGDIDLYLFINILISSLVYLTALLIFSYSSPPISKILSLFWPIFRIFWTHCFCRFVEGTPIIIDLNFIRLIIYNVISVFPRPHAQISFPLLFSK